MKPKKGEQPKGSQIILDTQCGSLSSEPPCFPGRDSPTSLVRLSRQFLFPVKSKRWSYVGKKAFLPEAISLCLEGHRTYPIRGALQSSGPAVKLFVPVPQSFRLPPLEDPTRLPGGGGLSRRKGDVRNRINSERTDRSR